MKLGRLTLELPESIIKDIDKRDVLFYLLSKALTKMEYYRTKCQQFESKYGKDLQAFRQQMENSKENFEWWDDFIVWEGYEQAYQEWKRKYEELKLVLQDN